MSKQIDLEKLREMAEDDIKRGRQWSTNSRDVLMLLDHIAELEKSENKLGSVIDKLRLMHKAEIHEQWMPLVANYRGQCEGLQAEVSALEKDAARYQFLRDSSCKDLWDKLMNTFPFAHSSFDRAIDTAMEASNAKAD